jgi:hypothetical protein
LRRAWTGVDCRTPTKVPNTTKNSPSRAPTTTNLNTNLSLICFRTFGPGPPQQSDSPWARRWFDLRVVLQQTEGMLEMYLPACPPARQHPARPPGCPPARPHLANFLFVVACIIFLLPNTKWYAVFTILLQLYLFFGKGKLLQLRSF